jgi:hypothetical protein
MIFGGINEERLQINEDTLWGGGPYNPNNPDALAALPEVRRLVFASNYTAAANLISRKVMARHARIRGCGQEVAGDARRPGDGLGDGVEDVPLGAPWRWRSCLGDIEISAKSGADIPRHVRFVPAVPD